MQYLEYLHSQSNEILNHNYNYLILNLLLKSVAVTKTAQFPVGLGGSTFPHATVWPCYSSRAGARSSVNFDKAVTEARASCFSSSKCRRFRDCVFDERVSVCCFVVPKV